jgi:DNA-binding transcriptional MocR family regulator
VKRATVISGATRAEIARSVESAIQGGTFAAGDRLPTVRSLADELRVSPATVQAAYRSLSQRGLVLCRGRRGTSVRGAPPLRTPLALAVAPDAVNLASGNPDPALLPPLERALARIDASPHLYGEDHQQADLVRLAAASFRRDGIPGEHLVVLSGALDGTERVLATHLRPGDRVALEDPGFNNVIDLVAALGLEAVPVRIDERGMLPAALERALRERVKAVVATPRAQNPTGAAFDAQRAAALRSVLRSHPGVLVLEDDYAGEVADAPFHSLFERGRRRWVVLRSVSKTLGPDLRLAVLAGDRETVAHVDARQRIGFRWVSHLLQQVVVALWTDRRLPALLRRAASTYTARRRALQGALAARGIEASGRSGLNVWVPVPEEAQVAQGLLAAGWAVAAGERFRLRSGPAIRITTATLDPADAPRVADALASCLAPRRTPVP